MTTTSGRLLRLREASGLQDGMAGILLHSLGIQKRAGKWSKGGWRNDFSTSPDTDSFMPCKVLAVGGWMTGYATKTDSGETWTFRVTEAGIAAIRLAGFKIETGTP